MRTIELAYERTVMDPIHGGIGLLADESAVIDQPLFQRLRHISQNDVLHYVFPGATHTRFAHSIGAMHTANRFMEAILGARLSTQGVSVQLDEPARRGFAYLTRVVRLAALLHDTGHGAFSHQMETTPAIREMLDAPGLAERLWAGADRARFGADEQGGLEHEHYSVRAAVRILTDVAERAGLSVAIEDVIGVMEHTDPLPSRAFLVAARDCWPLLAGEAPFDAATSGLQVRALLRRILSGEIDADKADYLLRDAAHTGADFGHYNLDNLLASLRSGVDPDSGELTLAVARKGLPAIEQFAYGRYNMYRHVYLHKTALGFELRLRAAIDEVLAEARHRCSLERMLGDIDAFTFLTDHFFWERFREIAWERPMSSAAALLERRKMQFLGELDTTEEAAVAAERARLAEALGVRREAIEVRSTVARFARGRDPRRALRVALTDRLSGTQRFEAIEQHSDLWTRLPDARRTALYLDPVVPELPGEVAGASA